MVLLLLIMKVITNLQDPISLPFCIGEGWTRKVEPLRYIYRHTHTFVTGIYVMRLWEPVNGFCKAVVLLSLCLMLGFQAHRPCSQEGKVDVKSRKTKASWNLLQLNETCVSSCWLWHWWYGNPAETGNPHPGAKHRNLVQELAKLKEGLGKVERLWAQMLLQPRK